MATTGHLFEEMMATYHSLGIAGNVAGKSKHPLGLPTALEEMRVEFHQRNLSSAVTWTLSGILNSSMLPLSSPSVSPQTVPQLTRVTAGGTVMFELESLVIQHFGSRHAYSSWHTIAEFRAGIPTRSPRTNSCWTSWALSFRSETRANSVHYGSSRGLRTPETKTDRLTATTVRHFKEQDGHMPSIWYREDSGKSSYVQWAIRQLWR